MVCFSTGPTASLYKKKYSIPQRIPWYSCIFGFRPILSEMRGNLSYDKTATKTFFSGDYERFIKRIKSASPQEKGNRGERRTAREHTRWKRTGNHGKVTAGIMTTNKPTGNQDKDLEEETFTKSTRGR